jgi:hypothetical protein
MILEPVTGAGGGGAARDPVEAVCQATDDVGHAVYVSGDKVGSLLQVTKADVDNPSKMPAIGLIVEKLSTTDCLVQLFGEVEDVYTGLTPNLSLFVGTDSRLTHVRPARPSAGTRYVQVLARALASNLLYVFIESPKVLVAA